MRHPLIASLLALAALQAAPSDPLQAQDAKQRTRCNETIDLFKKSDPHLEKYFGSAVGYAIFPSVGKGAFVVGGAAGTGCLYEGGAIIGPPTLLNAIHDALAPFGATCFDLPLTPTKILAAIERARVS